MDRILNAYTQELRVHRDHPGAGKLQMGANFNLAGLTIVTNLTISVFARDLRSPAFDSDLWDDDRNGKNHWITRGFQCNQLFHSGAGSRLCWNQHRNSIVVFVPRRDQ
jgi:hypothetical protein